MVQTGTEPREMEVEKSSRTWKSLKKYPQNRYIPRERLEGNDPIVTRIKRAGVIRNPRLDSSLTQKLEIRSSVLTILCVASVGSLSSMIFLLGKLTI